MARKKVSGSSIEACWVPGVHLRFFREIINDNITKCAAVVGMDKIDFILCS